MRTVNVPFFWVDAFCDRPYGGNPAAVCLLDSPAPAASMQSLAFEMGLSETAFVWPSAQDFSLRWFTPTAEVELCGHATVAAAHALACAGWLRRVHEVRFQTKSGVLCARVDSGHVEIDLPAETPLPCEPPPALTARWPVVAAATGRFDLVVEVVDEHAVRDAVVDVAEIAALSHRGVIVTARARDDGTSADDYVLRFFAPRVGIPEDPVTGSAQCVLGPYWGAVLGRSRLRARQLSARGGALDVAIEGKRARVGGRAVTVLSGTLSPDVAGTLRPGSG